MNDNQEKSMNNSNLIIQLQDQLDQLQEQIKQLEQTATKASFPTMIAFPDRAYSVGETPVTVEQYEYYCTQTNQKMLVQPHPRSPTNPVVNVTFHDARKYATWLSEYTGKSYRLPTEDEFEHCCGDHKAATSDIAVYDQDKVYPVKTKKPNTYGLYDMLGCVWEWQESLYATNSDRVIRGGSWISDAWNCRSAYRGRLEPDYRGDGLGFRVLKQETFK